MTSRVFLASFASGLARDGRARWLVLALAGCAGGKDPSVELCPGRCYTDTYTRCLSPRNCESDVDCPVGAVCGGVTPVNGDCPSEPAPSGTRVCRARRARATTGRDFTLIDGFGVQEFDRAELTGTNQRYAWQAPAGSDFVVCAMFGCSPDIVIYDEMASVDGRPRRRIDNFNKCALKYEIFNAATGEFDLARVRSGPVRAMVACDDGDVQRQPVLWTMMRVGCWAFRDSRVVAASPLTGVPPDILAATGIAVPLDATCNRDFDMCYDRDQDSFGTCLDGMCSPRCTEPSDCVVHVIDASHLDGGIDADPPADADGGVDSGTPDAAMGCPWECVRQSADSLIGVCRRVF